MRESFERVLLSKLLETAFSLKGMPISGVTPERLSEATEVVEEAEKMGLKIEWFDKVGKILEVKEHQDFTKKVVAIKEPMQFLLRQLDAIVEELEEAENKTARQVVDPLAVSGRVV